MTITLRSYQREAIDDTRARWEAGAQCVPVVCATGLGKSVIESHLADEWLKDNPGKRVLVIAHTYELIDQMVGHMRKTGRRVGVVMGGRNAPTAEIVVASRQTLANERRRNQLRHVGLIMIDECHFAVRANTYGTILEHFGAWPNEETGAPARVKVAGFTATLSRADKQKLSSIWEDCSFSRDIMFGIRNGFLMDVRGARIVVDELDMRNVVTKGGDYDVASLGEELERSFAVETIAKQYLDLAEGRKGLAFWPLVAVAQHAAEVFNDLGIPSGVVWGAQDKRERAKVLAAHKAGELRCVHNAMALTAGYDDPDVDVILMGRSTKSRGLYTQMAGRGLRPPTDPITGRPMDARTLDRQALLIDVTGASDDLDLALFIDLSPERPLNDAYERDSDLTLSQLDDLEVEILDEIALDLDDKRAGATWEFESDEYTGPVKAKEFDPLLRAKAWGQTLGGTYFLNATAHNDCDSFVFVVESLAGAPGTYDIVQCSNTGIYDPTRGHVVPEWTRGTPHVGMSLGVALSYGEELAGDAMNDRHLSSRKRKVSAKILADAARQGVSADPSAKRGEVLDAIDQAVATRLIDPAVKLVRSRVAATRSRVQ